MTALQEEFAVDAARLIIQLQTMGYTCSLGEAYRTPEQALLNAHTGAGIVHSLHIYRLAIDLNIFRNGIWLKDGADFADLGEWWTNLGLHHYWGGNFKTRPDGNHFSISPDNGVTQ